MTQELFWSLYDNNEISVTIFTDKDGNEIDAFQYNGKYYLRFVIYEDAFQHNRLYKNSSKKWVNSFIKEFGSKSSANNYFVKAAKGFTKLSS